MYCSVQQGNPGHQARRKRLWGGTLAALLLLTGPGSCLADNLADALRLLRVTEVGEDFHRATRQQTRNVIRTYSIIVAMSTDQELPDAIKQAISRCYEETFGWERFESGIATIFADNFTGEELNLLIDFFSDRSVPPPLIDKFKAVVARAETIEKLAVDYIFSQTQGCDAYNVNLILDYLADHG